MHLIALFEAIAPTDIDNMVQYASGRVFHSEEEARKFVASKDQAGSPWNLGPDGYWSEMAKVIPVYQTPKGWKFGDPKQLRRLKQRQYRRRKPSLSWKTMEIRGSSLFDLNNSAGAQEEAEYKILPVKMYRIAQILPEGEDMYSSGGEASYIRELADTIKKNRWFEAIYVHENARYVVEGQHRTRALKLLGFKTVPGYGFLYDL